MSIKKQVVITIKTKTKIIIGTVLLLITSVISGFLGVATDKLLATGILEIPSFPETINTLLNGGNALKFFALFDLAFFCLILIIILQNRKGYQSELIAVTNKISTPKATGQFQHGSARWLTKDEKAKEFKICVVDKKDNFIKELSQGKEVKTSE